MTRLLRITLALVITAVASCNETGDSTPNDTVVEQPDSQTVVELLSEIDALLWQRHDRGDLQAAELAESLGLAAYEIDPENRDVLNQLSRVKLARQKFSDVIQIQTYLLSRQVDNALGWGLQGDALAELGHYRNADSSYYVMYTYDDGFESRARISREEYALRDFDRAIAFMNEAIDLGESMSADPRELITAYCDLAEMLLSHGYLEAALRELELAMGLGVESVRVLTLKGRILQAMGSYAEAADAVKRAVAYSKDPHHILLLSDIYSKQGRTGEADSLVSRAGQAFGALFEKYPDELRRDYAAFLLEQGGDIERGFELAFEHSRKRRDVRAYSVLAWGHYKMGRYDLAWSSIALALRRKVYFPFLYHQAAIIAKAAGKEEARERYTTRIREINPHFEAVYGRLD